MEHGQPLFFLIHSQRSTRFDARIFRYLKPCSSWMLSEFPTPMAGKKGLLIKISFSFRTISWIFQLSSARINQFEEWRIELYSKLFKNSVILDSVIMLISLENNDASSDENGTYAAFVLSYTLPTFQTFCCCFILAILEALLILSINWIVLAATRKTRSINQDFVFFQDKIFNVPVVLCKINEDPDWILFCRRFMIMLISLQHNDFSFGFDGNFASQRLNFWTSPIYILLFLSISSISFAILEAMLILYFNRIPSANAWNEGPINQDVVFSKNNISYAPIVLCKINMYFRNQLIFSIMIMLKSLNGNDIAYGLDGTFAAFVNSWTFPTFISLPYICRVVFSVLETMLILHNNCIFPATKSKEGPIDQDFVFSQNNTCPVKLCKNEEIFQENRKNFLGHFISFV